MSWIPIVPREQAKPEVQKIYDSLLERWKFIPNYFLALGRDQQLLLDQINLFTNAMFDDRALPRVIKEQIALVVSGINTSSYCVAAHMEILKSLGVEKRMARNLAVDYPSAPVDPRVVELFRFAEKLTRRPAEMEKADVDRLRAAGWNDDEIFETVLVASLYSLANRFSSGLGLMPDF
jgi:uncharacterized peroxidase-related enzyme